MCPLEHESNDPYIPQHSRYAHQTENSKDIMEDLVHTAHKYGAHERQRLSVWKTTAKSGYWVMYDLPFHAMQDFLPTSLLPLCQ
jgi:hypothetical protein